MLFSGPAIVSNDPPGWTRWPASQFSSMNRSTELWSVSVWLTKLTVAKRETISSGTRVPYRPGANALTHTPVSAIGRKLYGGVTVKF